MSLKPLTPFKKTLSGGNVIWCARVRKPGQRSAYTKHYADDDGRRFTTREAALEWAMRRELAIKDQVVVLDADTVTLAQAIEYTEADYQQRAALPEGTDGHIEAGTARNKSEALRRLLVVLDGDMLLNELDRWTEGDVATKWVRPLSAHFSTASVQTTKSAFSRLCKLAMDKRWLRSNPVSGYAIKSAKDFPQEIVTEAKRDLMAQSSLRALLATMTEGNRLLAEFAIYTGIRQGEQRALCWRHIDFDAGMIYVRQAFKAGSRKIGSPKSKHSIRDVPMSPALAAQLREHRATLAETHGLQAVQADSFVFPTASGRDIDPKFFQHVMNRAVARAPGWGERARKVVGWSWHDLRHTYASLMLSSGMNLTDVACYMGHRDAGVTRAVYALFLQNEERDERARHAIQL